MASEDHDKNPDEPPRGAGRTPGAPSDGTDPSAAEAHEDDPGAPNEYGEALRRAGDGPRVA